MVEKEITEGKIKITIPEFDKVSSQAPVFYNPAMELNRDLSVLAISTFQKKLGTPIDICDAFTGSGIRGLRYKAEIDDVDRVVVNDINPVAIEFIKKNIELNNIDIEISHNDTNMVLRENRGKFDVVDIDPFGTPSFFMDSVGNNLKKDSLLCVTATDTSALCGTYKEPCLRKYNAMPLKSEYCHENGIRILAGFVAITLAKYKKWIQVLFSHSTEHYMRLYIYVRKAAKESDRTLREEMGFIAHCKKCLHRQVYPTLAPAIPEYCPVCGEKLSIGGPLWIGKIQNKEFIEGMLNEIPNKKVNTLAKIEQLLQSCYNEADAPITHYEIHQISKKLGISAPKLLKVLENLEKEDHIAVRTHFNPLGIKTDASLKKLENIILKLSSNK